MKLSKLCVILLLSIWINIGNQANAAGFIPKEIKLFSTETSFTAGTSQDFGIVPSTKELKNNSVYEYGVARQIKNGFITSFEILTTETKAVDNQIRVSVKIPNTTKEYASSSYVIYLKSYIKNDPESENFFVTPSFVIIPSADPFVFVKYVNLLQSNGGRSALTEGPTIYDPAQISTSSLASSTSIEVTFESNIDTVLKPFITFEKLRSTDTIPDVSSNDIYIKKGLNRVIIPLPTFNYIPGVYVGRVNFRNEQLKNELSFQYVIAGESATVGNVTYTPFGEFTFLIFGTPIDMRGPELASTSEIHTVRTVFMFGGKQVLATSTQVNFASTSFNVALPAHIRNVDLIKVEVVSNASGKTLYQSNKEIDFITETSSSNTYIFYIVFLGLLILFAILRHMKKFVIVLILFVSFIIGQQLFAETWDPNSVSYITARVNNYYTTEKFSNPVSIYFNENIVDKTFTCGENLSFMFKVVYIQCANTYAGLKVGFSTSSQSAANDSQIEVTNNTSGSSLESQTYAANNGAHYFYLNTSNFMRYNGAPITGSQTLYVAVSSTATDTRWFDPGYTTYSIPLNVSPCTACTNAPTTSNIPNFKVAGRNYYYASNGTLYYRDDNPSPSSPAATCGIDMCTDTTAAEEVFPAGKTWKPMPGSYSTDPNRYACLPINITCSCDSQRNRVCQNSNTGTSSTETNHSSCLLNAYCKSVTYSDRGLGTAVFDAYNKVGTLSFTPYGNPVTDLEVPPEGLILENEVTDSDGRSSYATCKLNFEDSIITNTATPSIRSFYANPKLVNEGGKCRFGWQTNNMTSCTIGGMTVPVNISAGDVYALENSSEINDQNLVKTLICSGQVGENSVVTVSTTTTCYVNPRLRED